MGIRLTTPIFPAAPLPRLNLSRWRAPQASHRVLWAGPGWGKSCVAALLAREASLPAVWLSGEASAGFSWAEPGASPQEALDTLVAFLRKEYPGGAALVLDDAHLAFDDPAAVEFLRLWLSAEPSCLSLVTTRRHFPFSLARGLAADRIRVFGPQELGLTEEERALWLEGAQVDSELRDAVGAWPLGVRSLVQGGHSRELCLEMVREELIASLPEERRREAIALSPLPLVSAEGVSLLLPGSDAEGVMDFARRWGLVGADGSWLHLAQKVLRSSWASGYPPEERRAKLERLCAHLTEKNPELAVAWVQKLPDSQDAIQLAHQYGLHLLGTSLDGWLKALAVEFEGRSAELELMMGHYHVYRGLTADGEACFERALQIARREAPSRALEAIARLFNLARRRNDEAACAKLTQEAEALQEEADDLAKACWYMYWGTSFFPGPKAEELYYKVLDTPVEGRLTLAFLQQLCFFTLSTAKFNSGDVESSKRLLKQALALGARFPMLSDISGLSYLYFYLAYIARVAQQREEAEEYFEQANASFSGTREVTHAFWEAAYYLSDGRLDEAEKKFLEALELTELSSAYNNVRANLFNFLAIVHRRKGDIPAALAAHEATLNIGAPWPTVCGRGWAQWALTLSQAGRHEEALAKLSSALPLLDSLDSVSDAVSGRLIAAVLHFRLGELPTASRFLDEAWQAIEKHACHFAVFFIQEALEDLWRLMLQADRTAMASALASRFPEQTEMARAAAALPDSAASRAAVSIRCFGPLELTVGGHRVETWHRKKAKALLAQLVLNPAGLSLFGLGEILFPELEGKYAEKQVYQAAGTLRNLLEPDAEKGARRLKVRNKVISLDLSGIELDLSAFDEAYKLGMAAYRAGRMDEAMAHFTDCARLYGGHLFDEPLLDEWFVSERSHYSRRAVEALDRLAARAQAQGDTFEEQRHLERLIALDPVDESAHRRLMIIFAGKGQSGRVIAQFENCARLLRDELGLEPDAETLALYERLTGR